MKIASKRFWFVAMPSVFLSIIILFFFPFYLKPVFKKEIINQAQKSSETISKHFIEKFLSENAIILSNQQFVEHEESIHNDIKIFNLWKVRFFNPDGVIVYSNIKSEINTINRKPFFLDKVAKGQILSKMEKKGGDTFSKDKIVPYDVVETYVPIMQEKTFIGAFEIYLNVSDQMERLKKLFWKSYITITIITFSLTAFIVLFSLKIDKFAKEREKLILKLQAALTEVKTLQGIIPICAHCKKIRDDQGFWNQVEGYIQKHSNAKFSHGMCPDCSNELYGKEDWYIEMKNKKRVCNGK